MKRLLVPFLFAAALVLSSCAPELSWSPTPTALTELPDSVSPGETFSFDIGGTNAQYEMLHVGLGTPVNTAAHDQCSTNIVERNGVEPITITCTIPTYATNGLWSVGLEAQHVPGEGQRWSPAYNSFPLLVEGGPTENGPPEFLGHTISTGSVDANTPFTFTLHMRDTSLPLWYGQSHPDDGDPYEMPGISFDGLDINDRIQCRFAAWNELNATDLDVVFECEPDGAKYGDYRASFSFRDQMYLTSYNQVLVRVSPPAG